MAPLIFAQKVELKGLTPQQIELLDDQSRRNNNMYNHIISVIRTEIKRQKHLYEYEKLLSISNRNAEQELLRETYIHEIWHNNGFLQIEDPKQILLSPQTLKNHTPEEIQKMCEMRAKAHARINALLLENNGKMLSKLLIRNIATNISQGYPSYDVLYSSVYKNTGFDADKAYQKTISNKIKSKKERKSYNTMPDFHSIKKKGFRSLFYEEPYKGYDIRLTTKNGNYPHHYGEIDVNFGSILDQTGQKVQLSKTFYFNMHDLTDRAYRALQSDYNKREHARKNRCLSALSSRGEYAICSLRITKKHGRHYAVLTCKIGRDSEKQSEKARKKNNKNKNSQTNTQEQQEQTQKQEKENKKNKKAAPKTELSEQEKLLIQQKQLQEKVASGNLSRMIAIDPNHKNVFYAVGGDGNAICLNTPWFLHLYDQQIDKVCSKRDKLKAEYSSKDKSIPAKHMPNYIKKRIIKLNKRVDSLRHRREESINGFVHAIVKRIYARYDIVLFGNYTAQTMHKELLEKEQLEKEQLENQENQQKDSNNNSKNNSKMNRKMINQSFHSAFKTAFAWFATQYNHQRLSHKPVNTVQERHNLSEKMFITFDEAYTTRTCHACGYVVANGIDPSIREWICPSCNAQHIRDENAAINGFYKSLYGDILGGIIKQDVPETPQKKPVKKQGQKSNSGSSRSSGAAIQQPQKTVGTPVPKIPIEVKNRCYWTWNGRSMLEKELRMSSTIQKLPDLVLSSS